jgi:hypothetical protein
MDIHDMTEQAYKNGYQKGYEAGRKAAAKAVKEMPSVSKKTLAALCKMERMTHNYGGRSCVTCVDGGIDMPHCSECNPSNGFAYYRKKV